MVPLLPLVAVLALGGYLYSRSRGAPAGVPPYDVSLDPATAQAVDYAIKGGIAADGSRIPPETDPARIRAFVARLNGYPIAQAALTRYAATHAGGASSSSSSSSSSFIASITAAPPPATVGARSLGGVSTMRKF
jgi:hypothetical protein